MISNTQKFLNNFWKDGTEKIHDFYQYRPPLYDIAVGIFRTLFTANIVGGAAWVVVETAAERLDVPALFNYSAPVALTATIGTLITCMTIELSSLLNQATVTKISQDQTKKKVALICQARSDWNGALNCMDRSTLNLIKQLARDHSIVTRKVENIQEINAAIDDVCAKRKKITTFWLGGHASPSCIDIGKELLVGAFRVVAKDAGPSLKKSNSIGLIHFHKLDLYADVLLRACSAAGNEVDENLNIAEWTQFFAGPTRQVHAANAILAFYGISRQQGTKKPSYSFRAWHLFGDITGKVDYSVACKKLISLYKIFNIPEKEWLPGLS